MLTGLSDTDSRALLEDRAGISGPAADRLLQVAAGNPLALLELPELVGTVPVAEGVEPLPVGPRVRQAFRDRLDRLPPATRLAVGVVAADGVAGLAETIDAFALLGLEFDALQAAEDEGLVSIDRGRVVLRHPLLRSVAYHALVTARAARGARRARDRARTSE